MPVELMGKKVGDQGEVWKQVRGYKKLYSISNKGRIKSERKNKKILKPYKDSYFEIDLTKNNIRKRFVIHRLLFETFNKKIKKGLEINHIDGDRYNNLLSNLECVTPLQNVMHNIKLGKQHLKRGINGRFIK